MSKMNQNFHGPGQRPENLGFYKTGKGAHNIPGKNPEKTVILTNEFYLTKSLNKAYARETFRIYKKKWRIGVYALAAAVTAVGLSLLFALQFLPVGIPLTVLGIYFFFMATFGYLWGAGISYRNLISLYGDPVKMKVQFHNQYFTAVTPQGNLDFLYKQIYHYYSFSEYDIFIVGAKGIIEHGQIIDKRSFTPEELNTYYSIIERNGLTFLS